MINDGGSGYVGSSATISIAPPVGVGTTATATVTLTNGVITGTTITNAGGGYSVSSPPVVLASFPRFSNEVVASIDTIEGFSGIVTGITTTTVGVSTLGLKFFLNKPASNWGSLSAGDPIYIYDTTIGAGVTSLATSGIDGNVVGIGISFFDNIYHIQSITSSGTNAEIITNIHSNAGSSVSGISSSVPIGLTDGVGGMGEVNGVGCGVGGRVGGVGGAWGSRMSWWSRWSRNGGGRWRSGR